MRKVMRKVKSKWAVLGVMGATVVALGTANVPGVSAEEVDGQTVIETSDTNSENATTDDSASIQEATVLEVSDLSAVSDPYDFYDWYETMGVDSYANGMRFYIDSLDRTIQLYVKTANDTGELYLTITQMGATVAEDIILIENQIIKPNTYYIFAEGQNIEPVYFSIVNRNADNYVEPNYNRFEEVSDESIDASNINNYSPKPNGNAYNSEGLHFYESDGKLIGEAVIYVEMLGRYAPSASGEIKYDTVYKFVNDNNEIEYFKVVKETSPTDSNFSQIISETVVDYPATISLNDNAINTQPWNVKGWQTVGNSSDILDKTVNVTKEQVTDYGVTWAWVSKDGKELGWIAKDALTIQTYAAITSETVVDYPATIRRDTDAINLAPWGTKGYQTIASSAAYVGKTVDVIKEQTTDYGVTWAQISLNGEVLGWIAKDALAVQTYAAVVSETVVDYPATVNRDSDAINTAPWGVKGYQTLSSSAAYTGQTVEVKKEQVTDYGVTWAQISLNGEVLGWIAKDALKIQTYAQITKETAVDYSATISRDSDAINTAPWGVKGYQTLSSSAAYVGQTVEVTKEQVTDYGVTWALVSQNGKELGWIAKDALKVQTYAQITKETAVNYDAIVNRDSDAINTAPWGVKGYQTLSSSATYVGQTVEVTKEQVTDYGVTWALVSQNGKELGWIAKDALKVQTYAQITKETAVSYDAIVNRDSDAINTVPWGVKGFQTLSSSAAYVGQTVEVTKEQTTDYGVTWARISLNGEVLGWIAKDALKVQTYAQIVSENEVAYPALINRGTDAINTAPWGTKGYQTNASSADYLGQTVEVTKEQTTDYGVTWSLVSLNGKELGWIAKDALIVLEKTIETVVAKENTVAYQTATDEDNMIPTGESQVAQAGAEGYDTVTYDVTYVNGIETNRVEVSRTTTAPVNEIVKVGTQVTEVKSETTTENEVDFTTVEEEDNTIPTGERVVVQAGVKGYDTVTYDVTYVNGIETNRVEISRETTAPVAEIVKVGTQVTEVKSESATENEVAFTIVEEFDNTIPIGERVVVQAGLKGYDTITYNVTYVNGVKTNRVEISRATTAPVSEIVKVGTQVTEVKSEMTTENEVTYATLEEFDNTIPTGERILVQTGANGYDTVTYDVTYVNGIEMNRVETSRTTAAPVAEVNKVGTKQIVANIGSFTIEQLSVDASGIYKGYNSKDVILRMNATLKDETIVNAYVNYNSINGYSDKFQFVSVGTNTFEATIPLSSQYTEAGLYQASMIGVEDSNGNEWVIFQEGFGFGSGPNFITADLSAADFNIKESSGLASVAGVTVETIAIENAVVYVDEWTSNKITMKVTASRAPITKASITFTLPNGWDKSCDFVSIGNDTYEATITPYPTSLVGAGSYGIESINITDSNGDYVVFFPEGNGTGLNYDSGNLSGGYFEVKERVVVTTEYFAAFEYTSFETIYQGNPDLLIGETQLIQSGADGLALNYYTVTYINGIETSRERTSSQVVNAPVNEIIAVGTREIVASIGGFVIDDISVDNNIVYEGDWSYKTITMKGYSNYSTITNAYINYQRPDGQYGQEIFSNIGNNTYVASVPTFTDNAGFYRMDSIVLIDANWNSWVVLPEGNGSGSNYTSGDLSKGDFEVLVKPVVATVGDISLETISMDESSVDIDAQVFSTLTITASSNGAAVTSATSMYRLPSGSYTQMHFENLGNGTFKALIPTFIDGVGTFLLDSITFTDANGNSWVVMSEGKGSGYGYTSADLSSGNINVYTNTIASVGGVSLKSLSMDTNPVYKDDMIFKTLRITVSPEESMITSAYANYKLPSGAYTQMNFGNLGSGTFETSIPTFIDGFGLFQLDSIILSNAYGNIFMFLPEGNGSGANYTSGDLTAGNFEVL